MKTHLVRLATLALLSGPFVGANSTLNTFSVQPFPEFGVAPGLVTSNGASLETVLRGYYRLWLTHEGLLTGNDAADAAFVYLRPNVAARTTEFTAQSFASGLLPAGNVNITLYPQNSDPLFNPVGAGVGLLDQKMAIRSVLFSYPASETPAPLAPAGKVDVTTIPLGVTAGSPVEIGGLNTVAAAIDPFLMQYADKPFDQGDRVNRFGRQCHRARRLIPSRLDPAGLPSRLLFSGGALVFELRQSQSTAEYIVRASYIAQTMDQLRNQTVLTLDAPPAIAPLFIPCLLEKFVRLSKQAIDRHSVDWTN